MPGTCFSVENNIAGGVESTYTVPHCKRVVGYKISFAVEGGWHVHNHQRRDLAPGRKHPAKNLLCSKTRERWSRGSRLHEHKALPP